MLLGIHAENEDDEIDVFVPVTMPLQQLNGLLTWSEPCICFFIFTSWNFFYLQVFHQELIIISQNCIGVEKNVFRLL